MSFNTKTLDGAYDMELDNLIVNEKTDLKGESLIEGQASFLKDLELENPTAKIILSAVQATADYAINLPPTIGVAGQALFTDGFGNSSWQNTGAVGAVSYVGMMTAPGLLVNGASAASTTSSITFSLTFDASSPIATTFGGTGLSTVGTADQVLTSNGTTLLWATPAAPPTPTPPLTATLPIVISTDPAQNISCQTTGTSSVVVLRNLPTISSIKQYSTNNNISSEAFILSGSADPYSIIVALPSDAIQLRSTSIVRDNMQNSTGNIYLTTGNFYPITLEDDQGGFPPVVLEFDSFKCASPENVLVDIAITRLSNNGAGKLRVALQNANTYPAIVNITGGGYLAESVAVLASSSTHVDYDVTYVTPSAPITIRTVDWEPIEAEYSGSIVLTAAKNVNISADSNITTSSSGYTFMQSNNMLFSTIGASNKFRVDTDQFDIYAAGFNFFTPLVDLEGGIDSYIAGTIAWNSAGDFEATTGGAADIKAFANCKIFGGGYIDIECKPYSFIGAGFESPPGCNGKIKIQSTAYYTIPTVYLPIVPSYTPITKIQPGDIEITSNTKGGVYILGQVEGVNLKSKYEFEVYEGPKLPFPAPTIYLGVPPAVNGGINLDSGGADITIIAQYPELPEPIWAQAIGALVVNTANLTVVKETRPLLYAVENSSIFSIKANVNVASPLLKNPEDAAVNGAWLSVSGTSWTNTKNLGGTVPLWSSAYFGYPTIVSTETTIYPTVANVFIEQPIAGFNSTVTLNYALYVNGTSRFIGNITTAGDITTSGDISTTADISALGNLTITGTTSTVFFNSSTLLVSGPYVPSILNTSLISYTATAASNEIYTVANGILTYPIGTVIVCAGFTPADYDGIYTVTSGTFSSITTNNEEPTNTATSYVYDAGSSSATILAAGTYVLGDIVVLNGFDALLNGARIVTGLVTGGIIVPSVSPTSPLGTVTVDRPTATVLGTVAIASSSVEALDLLTPNSNASNLRLGKSFTEAFLLQYNQPTNSLYLKPSNTTINTLEVNLYNTVGSSTTTGAFIVNGDTGISGKLYIDDVFTTSANIVMTGGVIYQSVSFAGAAIGITSANALNNALSTIETSISNNVGYCRWFMNSTAKTSDGGSNGATIRNEIGPLTLSSQSSTASINLFAAIVTVTGTLRVPALSASRAVFTDIESNLVSRDTTGSGFVVLSASPILQTAFRLAGATSGTISFKAESTFTDYNFNMPSSAGSNGQVLTSRGGGALAMYWDTPTTGTVTSVTASSPLTSTGGATPVISLVSTPTGTGTVLVLSTSPTIVTPIINTINPSGTFTVQGPSFAHIQLFSTGAIDIQGIGGSYLAFDATLGNGNWGLFAQSPTTTCNMQGTVSLAGSLSISNVGGGSGNLTANSIISNTITATTLSLASITLSGNLTMNGGYISQTASFAGAAIGITSANTSTSSAASIENSLGNSVGYCRWFLNSSTKTTDGGANGATIRNDAGALTLSSTASTASINLSGSTVAVTGATTLSSTLTTAANASAANFTISSTTINATNRTITANTNYNIIFCADSGAIASFLFCNAAKTVEYLYLNTASYTCQVNGTFNSTGAALLSSTLAAVGATTLSSTLLVSGATTLSSSLNVSGAITFGSSAITVNGGYIIQSVSYAGSAICLTAANTSSSSAATIETSISNNVGYCRWFLNSSTKTTDGGANGATFRNDAGALTLSNAGSTASINLSGSTTTITGTIVAAGNFRRIQSGTTSSATTGTVTFATAFAATPSVTITAIGSGTATISTYITAVSTSAFSWACFQSSGSGFSAATATGNYAQCWIATDFT
jgi:hypothetical protein